MLRLGDKDLHILFRVPFTRYFLGIQTLEKHSLRARFLSTWFGFFRKEFDGEYYWEEI